MHYYGNYISNGENPKEGCWKNFLTEHAFNHAKDRVEHKENYETIESDRLFNNLLSSQPMAFNLFCPLRQMREKSPETATKVIKAALPNYPIHKVTEVALEFIPANHEKLTGDKSAMDAIIRFEDEQGKKGFIAIETKYSENLGTNVAYDRDENGKKIPRAKSIEAVKEPTDNYIRIKSRTRFIGVIIHRCQFIFGVLHVRAICQQLHRDASLNIEIHFLVIELTSLDSLRIIAEQC